MAYTATYFVNNRPLGSSEILAHITPHSFVFVCPKCGESWGRIFVSGGESQHWEVEAHPCEKHTVSGVQDWGTVPGAFLPIPFEKSKMRVTAWARSFEHLPEAVLKREFELTLTWFDRKFTDEQDD